MKKDDPRSYWSKSAEVADEVWGKVLRVISLGNKEKARREMVRANRLKLEARRQMGRCLLEGHVDWDKVLDLVFGDIKVPIDAEHPTSGLTPLIRAAEENVDAVGYTPIKNADGDEVLSVELLLDRERYRPKVDYENSFGHSALSWAAVKERLVQMEALIKRGADVNRISEKKTGGATPLILAAKHGKKESTRLLLESGSDPAIKDSAGLTALDWASKSNHVGTVAVLLHTHKGDRRPSKGVARGGVRPAALLLGLRAHGHGESAEEPRDECLSPEDRHVSVWLRRRPSAGPGDQRAREKSLPRKILHHLSTSVQFSSTRRK